MLQIGDVSPSKETGKDTTIQPDIDTIAKDQEQGDDHSVDPKDTAALGRGELDNAPSFGPGGRKGFMGVLPRGVHLQDIGRALQPEDFSGVPRLLLPWAMLRAF